MCSLFLTCMFQYYGFRCEGADCSAFMFVSQSETVCTKFIGLLTEVSEYSVL